MKQRTFLAIALLAALCAPALAQPVEGGDPAVRAQDDLFRHVNGAWLDATAIPGDKRSYGTFMLLREKSEVDVRALLEAAAATPGTDRNSRLIGDFYAALLDEKTAETRGLAALKADLTRIAGLKRLDDVATELAHLLAIGVPGPVVAGVDADPKNPLTNVVFWAQSGLGMPDRDYYLKQGPEAESLRAAYLAYLSEINRLAKIPSPEAAAKKTLAFETALAELHWTTVDRRDALKTYNPAPRATWAKDYPAFPWERFAQALGMPSKSGAIVMEPSYFKGFAKLAAKTSMADWKAYLTSRMLDNYAEYLGKPYQQAYYRFKGERLQGLQAMPPRWRMAVGMTSDALGEAIGARYVAKHFPVEAKARMQTLVSNLLAVYRESLENLSWMTPETRKAALDKLSKFSVKIGYPDQWRGYDGLVVRRDDAIGNIMRASRFAFGRDMAEAGKPVDRARWHMTPQTVNAYYNPLGNEIVFPAAILQPPFFDPKADDAYNYGAIGAVIGHEISHGFDDQGRHYDGDGRLRDWWTEGDQAAFEAKAGRLIAQYDSYEPLPGERVNGRLTLGENIADLTGVAMALKAYHRSLGDRPAASLDGLTPDQRFFYGYARVWRSKSRDEWLKTRLLSDPHSPEQFRTNGVVTNLDAFYDAFGLKMGDKLFKRPEDRIRIW
ncbi:M13 family metallopeptidase [bacterium]|nr:M13 family metallopeptidase [bacterium]